MRISSPFDINHTSKMKIRKNKEKERDSHVINLWQSGPGESRPKPLQNKRANEHDEARKLLRLALS